MILCNSKMSRPYLQIFYLCLLIVLCLSAFSVTRAYSSNDGSLKLEKIFNLPEEYGRVIYNKKGENNKRVYIIFQAHRSSVTGLSDRNTVQAQSDIYRIEEWLVQNENVQLLLPEGFFKSRDKDYGIPENGLPAATEKEVSIHPLGDEALKSHLSDTSEFVNADKLLYRFSNLRFQQIENRELYFEVYRYLSDLKDDPGQLDDRKSSRIARLQSKRNARLLQNLPRVIEEEYETGRIGTRRAIFTIGLAHAPDIIRFVEENRIEGRLLESEDQEKRHKLNLAESGYHVTMIMPRALMDIADRFALNAADDNLKLY